MENQFKVPRKDEVSVRNQELFEEVEKSIGKVPNLYATFGYSEKALEAYWNIGNVHLSLSPKEVEAINITVSQVNHCNYCLSAHRLAAKAMGFSDQEVAEIRAGKASFDPKLNALCRLTKNIVEQQQEHSVDPALIDAYFEAGYTRENLIDTILLIGIKTIQQSLTHRYKCAH